MASLGLGRSAGEAATVAGADSGTSLRGRSNTDTVLLLGETVDLVNGRQRHRVQDECPPYRWTGSGVTGRTFD